MEDEVVRSRAGQRTRHAYGAVCRVSSSSSWSRCRSNTSSPSCTSSKATRGCCGAHLPSVWQRQRCWQLWPQRVVARRATTPALPATPRAAISPPHHSPRTDRRR
jgi:hypothetical protein